VFTPNVVFGAVSSPSNEVLDSALTCVHAQLLGNDALDEESILTVRVNERGRRRCNTWRKIGIAVEVRSKSVESKSRGNSFHSVGEVELNGITGRHGLKHFERAEVLGR